MIYTTKKVKAAALGFIYAMAGLAPVSADDTDIFFGRLTTSVVKPNVLFILDNSGSMRGPVGGAPYSSTPRITALRNAFKNIMTQTTGINVGLMRFNDPGGPIIYPVTDIDAQYEDNPILTLPIKQSSDDASESLASGGGDGSTNLTNDYLDLGFSQQQSTSFSIQSRVSSDSDDAEEYTSGSVDTYGQSLDINAFQINGLRFQNLEIPRQATIDSASITFTSREQSSGELSIRLYGESSIDATTFSQFSWQNISRRPKTANSVSWQPRDWFPNQTHTSPDLSPIVQEIVSNSSWASGNSIAFIQTHEGGWARTAYTHNGRARSAPLLNVSYHVAVDQGIAKATGLRFQNVTIPRGARVTRAYIQLVPKVNSTSGSALSLNIKLEDSANAGTYSTAAGNISAASYLNSSVSWNPGDWVQDAPVKTPDLSTLIQQVVDRSDWCGGHAMAFKIQPESGSANSKRLAYSFDANSAKQPQLVVEYSSRSVPDNTCQQVSIRRQIAQPADDAEEYSNGGVDDSGHTLNINGNQVNGLRFVNLPLKPGAKIREAHLIFTAKESDGGAATMTLQAQNAVNPDNFANADNYNISRRDKVRNASVKWSSAGTPALTDWTAGTQYTSPDISALIQPLVNKPDWNSNANAIVFLQRLSGSQRRSYTWDHLPGGSAALEIMVEAGDMIAANGDNTDSGDNPNSGRDVRGQVIDLVDSMEANSWTVIVDTLYEAARYFRGDPVYWGKSRKHVDANGNAIGDERAGLVNTKRVSHSDSWIGGTRVMPEGCSDDNLNSDNCLDEHITGNPVYISPIKESCQANYIVLLSDGQANMPHSEELIKNYIGHSGSCMNSNPNEACSEELIQWLATEDQAPDVNGKNTVKTFTIAFALDENNPSQYAAMQYLENLAEKGQGAFMKAGSEAELLNAFNEIFQVALDIDTTFAAPAATMSQFNSLTNYEDVYFALFKPGRLPRWVGNLKKYKVADSDPNEDNYIGQNGNLAILPGEKFFSDEVTSFWTDGDADGSDVTAGGAAMELPDNPDNRKVYTYYSDPSASTFIKNNPLHEDNEKITTAMLGITGKLNPDSYRVDLLKWARGVDLEDIDNDGDTSDGRKQLGDPLHSQPVAVTYGGSETAPDITIFMTTNEGYLHAFDGDTGEELFAFIPEQLLPNLTTLYDNSITQKHPYGLDGSITRWVYDANRDGDIKQSDGDHVYLYFGMRRGGDHYYALDVTDRDNPKLMWILNGGASPYGEMGQSWADPVKARVAYTENDSLVTKDVLLISGGYDPDQDTHSLRTEDNKGRAVFMVEAGYPSSSGSTGSSSTPSPKLIWSAGNGTRHDLNLSDMKYSIPGSVKAGDTDNDGLVDILFVADVGGQIWRFDVNNGAELDDLVSGGLIADFAEGGDKSATDARRFYADIDATTYIQSGRTQIALTIGSGWRANPLDKVVEDRFYMVKQPFTKPAQYTKLTESDLYDATRNKAGSDDVDIRTEALEKLQSANGWFITLKKAGEKVLSQSLTFQSKVFFTSYEPNQAITTCEPVAGSSYLFGVNLYDATPLFNNKGEIDPKNASSRTTTSSSNSIPSDGILTVTKKGTPKVNSGLDSKKIPGELVKKTYWYQPAN